MKSINNEFGLNLTNRNEVSNFYYTALKDIKSAGKLKVIEGELSDMDIKRNENIDSLMGQMNEINKILWSYYRKLQEYEKVLDEQIEKWKSILKSSEEPDAEIVSQLRSTITSSIANVSVISSNILKQLELQTRLMGYLSRPSTVNISNLDITMQIHQSLKRIYQMGYFMIKPIDEETKQILEKLIKERKLRNY